MTGTPGVGHRYSGDLTAVLIRLVFKLYVLIFVLEIVLLEA